MKEIERTTVKISRFGRLVLIIAVASGTPFSTAQKWDWVSVKGLSRPSCAVVKNSQAYESLLHDYGWDGSPASDLVGFPQNVAVIVFLPTPHQFVFLTRPYQFTGAQAELVAHFSSLAPDVEGHPGVVIVVRKDFLPSARSCRFEYERSGGSESGMSYDSVGSDIPVADVINAAREPGLE